MRAAGILVLAFLDSCFLMGCGGQNGPVAGGGAATGSGYSLSSEIRFLDDVQSNAPLDAGLSEIELLDVDGKQVRLGSLTDGKRLVVVVLRGAMNPLCPYCSTQTAEYIRSYSQLKTRNAEVVIVFPVERFDDGGGLEEFLTDARTRLNDPHRPVPFPVLLDSELKLVDQLGIRKNLSKPATYILDTSGQVQYAYVGATLGDRPSVKTVLAQLDSLK